ncbi:hypothetical protein EV06_1251 [Prochlorococcus sp. MIT 0602]|nr:hypothetical protein EV06_1251 [Prochlorococcus sp. MIT 0602]KGG17658.1 hypothetical protein EV07_1098 [Prochlorococcus sp. MIT 0603]
MYKALKSFIEIKKLISDNDRERKVTNVIFSKRRIFWGIQYFIK